jgi:hypothetical protein
VPVGVVEPLEVVDVILRIKPHVIASREGSRREIHCEVRTPADQYFEGNPRLQSNCRRPNAVMGPEPRIDPICQCNIIRSIPIKGDVADGSDGKTRTDRVAEN